MLAAAQRESLARSFDALSHERRIALLEELRTPQILAHIALPAGEDEGAVSRQTVSKHLQRLLEAGLVARREVEREGRDTVEFVIDHQNLYALSEAVRSLARLRPLVESANRTIGSALVPRSGSPAPCLVAARALEEGLTYSLDPSKAARSWTIGRRRDSSVALDYDPAVSATHCQITWSGREHVIEDLGSRNGTSVSLRALAAQERRPLAHGDIIGVGSCMLVYWAR